MGSWRSYRTCRRYPKTINNSPEGHKIMLSVKSIPLLVLATTFHLLTGCSHQPKVYDCYTINKTRFCIEVPVSEQLKECVDRQQAIFRGQESSLPAYCDKFKDEPDMNRVIQR